GRDNGKDPKPLAFIQSIGPVGLGRMIEERFGPLRRLIFIERQTEIDLAVGLEGEQVAVARPVEWHVYTHSIVQADCERRVAKKPQRTVSPAIIVRKLRLLDAKCRLVRRIDGANVSIFLRIITLDERRRRIALVFLPNGEADGERDGGHGGNSA